jgi:hypothetical protein
MEKKTIVIGLMCSDEIERRKNIEKTSKKCLEYRNS